MYFKIGRIYLFVSIESALSTSTGDINILKTPAVRCVDEKGIVDYDHFRFTGRMEYRRVTKTILKEFRCSDCLVQEEYPGYIYFFRDEKGEIYSAKPCENQSPKPEDFGDFIVSKTDKFGDVIESYALLSNLIRNAYNDSLFNQKQSYCRNTSIQFQCDDKTLFVVNSNESQTRYFQYLVSIIPPEWELVINLHQGSKFDIVNRTDHGGKRNGGTYHQRTKQTEVHAM